MEWYGIAIIMIVALLTLMLIGVPIGVTLGLVSFCLMIPALGFARTFGVMIQEVAHFWSGYELLAVPLFVFMGEFFVLSGYADTMFEAAGKWLNRLPGGLALTTIGACAIFGCLSGSAIAGTATIGRISIPQMLNKGYSDELATGTIVSAGSLAHLIPPSIMMVLYSLLVEISPTKTQMAGLIPGFLMAFCFALVVVVWVWIKPSIAPREPGVTWKARFIALKGLTAPLILALVVLGAIYTGITTLTEAAAVGAVAAFILTLTKWKGFDRQKFVAGVTSVVLTSSFILLIAVGGKLLSWVLSYYRVPQHLLDIFLASNLSPMGLVMMIMVLYIFLGMFIDPLGMMYITVPLLAPILVSYDMSLIWFGVLMLINMEMANITPPVGMALFIVKGISPPHITFGTILRGSAPFFIAILATLMLVAYIPDIALWIPNHM